MRRPLFLDLAAEAGSALSGRMLRSALTATGIALGITALTAMIGMTSSAADSIGAEFDALRATRVEVSGPETVAALRTSVKDSGLARTRQLNGVKAAGVSAAATERSIVLDAHPGAGSVELPLVATESDALLAEKAEVMAGRLFDSGNEARADRIVLLGEDAAQQAGITAARIPSRVAIDGVDFVVAGIVTTDDVASLLPSAVIMPLTTARSTGFERLLGPPMIVIRTRAGAAEQVGGEAPTALDPLAPRIFSSAVPPRPASLERAIREQTRLQMLALAIVSIVVGAIGVSNTTLVGVLERRQEIGVRRAIGAGAGSIVVQFLLESAVLGLVGGAIGSVVGAMVTFVAASLNSWHLVIPPWLLPLGPVLGLLVGLLAGAYPAYRASRVEPIEALRA